MYLDPNETEELCADRTTEHVYKIPRVRWERLLGCFDVLPHFSRTIHNTFERLHTQLGEQGLGGKRNLLAGGANLEGGGGLDGTLDDLGRDVTILKIDEMMSHKFSYN